MSIVETTVTFATKGEEVDRVKRKCNKDRLAEAVVSIRRFLIDPDIMISPEAKLNSIQRQIEDLYW